jgi:hypothetical protein
MIIDSKTIAIDFDGTIVENKYPKIGKPLPFAFETLKMLQQDGHRLILWTVRQGNELKVAIDFCKERGIEFYAVNESFPGEDDSGSRKLNVDYFIDDRNLPGFPGWGEVYQLLNPERTIPKKKRWGLF